MTPTSDRLSRTSRGPRRSRSRLAAVTLGAALLGAGAPTAYAALTDDDRPAATSAAVPSRQAEGRPYIETSLLFGTARPNGGPPVTDKEFHAFVDAYVTPRFPAGLTVQDGYGQYRDSHGTIERERSYELILLYPTSEAGPNDPKIEQIRAAYLKRFGQESVARIDDRARVDF
ncbi:DUF3574 domain-containing protein [Streptomyces albofaciens JCM 4342]|uniref:DUF3574 domain-containing protein n=1 Tax=Streptomyces albofaciens TaxID=66866 RepID=UPI00123A67D3|nr:DUF3574 domain-containing protein [Streptomyces albofaciens]KAA6214641.1 DUF3574 domain-containing protein [Streptomyces albofaciens JCM 4342]